MIPPLQKLGQSIEEEWRCRSYDDEAFPEIAVRHLELRPPTEYLTGDRIVDWVFSEATKPVQPRGTMFGEPSVLLFQESRFYIEALFWREGTTDIHQHAFSGAFSVLGGSSVHSHWKFEPHRTINSRMIGGSLLRESTEILRVGDTRPILAGNGLIHQLFHLDLPSITLVVRTTKEDRHLPQYKYLPPGLSIDPFDEDPLRRRRLSFLEAMGRGQLDGLIKYTKQWIESGDLESIYYCFASLARKTLEPGLLEDLFDYASARHGEVIDLFKRVCDAARRTRTIINRRARITDAEPRFLLALLMLMPDRDSIFSALTTRFPGVEPVESIDRIMLKSTGSQVWDFGYSGVRRAVFQSLIRCTDEASLLDRLAAQFDEESLQKQRSKLVDFARKLYRSDLLHPLMSDISETAWLEEPTNALPYKSISSETDLIQTPSRQTFAV